MSSGGLPEVREVVDKGVGALDDFLGSVGVVRGEGLALGEQQLGMVEA